MMKVTKDMLVEYREELKKQIEDIEAKIAALDTLIGEDAKPEEPVESGQAPADNAEAETPAPTCQKVL